ncbi:MAG: outer membrane lipoprotein carrier protein LolA, partial [Candidatus Tectimicrobiota bacterium]
GKITDVYRVSVESITGSPEGAAWRLVLIPKEETLQVKELRLDVAKATFDIIRSVTVDHFGNVTDIRYTKRRINRGLDEDIFSLKLPPGVRRVKRPPISFD